MWFRRSAEQIWPWPLRNGFDKCEAHTAFQHYTCLIAFEMTIAWMVFVPPGASVPLRNQKFYITQDKISKRLVDVGGPNQGTIEFLNDSS